MGEVSAPSKRDALLKHIVEYYGVTLPDMKADTLRRRVEDPGAAGRQDPAGHPPRGHR